MERIKLGNEGLIVSKLGHGCMGLLDFGGKFTEKESIKTVHKAFDLGINHYDTADIYDTFDNEVFVGKILKEIRKDVVIATKFGIVRSKIDPKVKGLNGTPAYSRKCCEGSLLRLGTDVIDIFYLHRIDPETPIEETIGGMADLVKEGKVRYIGLSEVSVDILNKAHKEHPITAVQTEYSLLSRDAEKEIIPICKELGIGFVAYSPLSRGLLTAKIKSSQDLESNDFRKTLPRFKDENLKNNLILIEILNEFALSKNCTLAQLSLAWCIYQSENIFPIQGTKQIDFLKENIKALDLKLSVDDDKFIRDILEQNPIFGERYPSYLMKSIYQ